MMDGNMIYIGGNYIAGVSDTFGAKIHRHPLIEIYVSCDGKSHIITERGVEQGAIIVIGPNADHAIADTEKPGIALFLDPLTETGYSLWRNALDERLIRTAAMPDSLRKQLDEFPAAFSGSSLRCISDHLLETLQGDPVERPFDQSVLQTIALLADEDCDFDMAKLSGKVFLSKSRLAHVFSAQTGITLKEYLQYKRLESACRKMLRGANITEAAFATGFAGSSHIATSSMKLTGMQLRKMLGL